MMVLRLRLMGGIFYSLLVLWHLAEVRISSGYHWKQSVSAHEFF